MSSSIVSCKRAAGVWRPLTGTNHAMKNGMDARSVGIPSSRGTRSVVAPVVVAEGFLDHEPVVVDLTEHEPGRLLAMIVEERCGRAVERPSVSATHRRTS